MQVLSDFEQGSGEWEKVRCGKITTSRSKDLMTGGAGKTQQNYILDIVAERLSGMMTPTHYNQDMERGHFFEEAALQAFQETTGLAATRVGFVIAADPRIGCSPDALVEGHHGVEVKSPAPRKHIHNIASNGLEAYYPQVQGNMWVCECETWYLVSFCPFVKQYPVLIKEVKRDDQFISLLSKAAVEAADMVDDLVAEIAAKQHTIAPEVAATAELARVAWEGALAERSEVIL